MSNKMLENRLSNDLEIKIKNIIDEIYNDVKMDIDPELNFEDVMVDMVQDRLDIKDVNSNNDNRVKVEKFIRSIL